MKLVISIPVHEYPEVVLNQLENIWKWVPETIVVLHVSSQFDFSIPQHKQLYINPTRYPSHGSCVLKLHLLNYQYIREQIPDLDYFSCEASNDLFIKSGLLDYISNFVGGAAFHPFPVYTRVVAKDGALIDPARHWIGEHFYAKDEQCQAMFPDIKPCFGPFEFTYYRRDMADKIFHVIKDIDYEIHAYAREEILPSMLLHHFGKNLSISEPYGMVWYNRAPEIEDIEEIRTYGWPSFPSEYYPEQHELFAIKRVGRRADGWPLRNYIRNLCV